MASQFADADIFNVTVNGNSTDTLYSYNNGCSTVASGPGSVLKHYANFVTPLSNLYTGSTVPFSIVQDDCDGPVYFANSLAIWIDYDKNSVFDNSEKVYSESVTTIGPRTASGTFTVPITALPGLYGYAGDLR